ncbi:Fic family protein [Herbaspirillum huttiense]|uniref:Fic family protein n=2 Tax=Herbaspirillum huttiense TaxID=863372 RepID=A0AAJ2HBU0_9BURK|nr:Fic family protein [Herbaspirillum huttiense]MDR9837651.1 Fic family protein [Herbaspirillum huttiense]
MVKTTDDIAAFVRTFIHKNGISEESIAVQSGLEQALVRSILAGRADYDARTLIALLNGAGLEMCIIPKMSSQTLEILFASTKPTVKTRVDIAVDGLRAQEEASNTHIEISVMKKEESLNWRPAAEMLFTALAQPWEKRPASKYRLELLAQYRPNVDSLLPQGLADELAVLGEERAAQEFFMPTRQMEKFVLEFSWASCRLEREKMSLEEAKKIIDDDAPRWRDEASLVSNADAIKMVMQYGREWPLSVDFVRNSHVQIMKDLLATRHLGRTRTIDIHVAKSRFMPLCRAPDIDEMLELVCALAAEIKNPIEAAFFLWLHIAYLQAFIEGNTQASRVVANIPLVKACCIPISFIEINIHDYTMAMLGFYELGDVSVAVDVFEWSYRRSAERYTGIWHLGHKARS